jgi:hypothetical protein
VGDFENSWIKDLASREPSIRTDAATQIYAAGRTRADRAIYEWWSNHDFAQLFGPKPVATVGLAVTPETFARIREANGSPRLAEVPTTQDASEFELHFTPEISLDILTTRSPEGAGAIARFLSKYGEGVQQVEFRCYNVDRATQLLRESFGVQPVYPSMQPGADGTRINFFLVAGADGKKVLVELYEPELPG